MNRMFSIKAPLTVRLNRILFLVYVALCLMGMWDNVSFYSLVVCGGFILFSLIALGFSFFRTHLSRYIVAALALAIPSVYFALKCLLDGTGSAVGLIVGFMILLLVPVTLVI
jgi:hypothetical protein